MNIEYVISRGTRGINAILWSWIYIPHLLVYTLGGRKKLIKSDLATYRIKIGRKMPDIVTLIFLLHNNVWFRSFFYYRIGPIWTWLISWYRPGDKSFMIPYHVKIGSGFHQEHAYSTVLNANSIGKNFHCIQGITIGKKDGKRPVIGDNVSVFAHAIIVGDVKIGNNVTIGAGAVVVKDVPDNAVVVGNPARVIKYKDVHGETADSDMSVN